MSIKKLNQVFSLNPKERYGYLIKKVADFELIYTVIDSNGDYGYLAFDDENIIPFWPERLFVQEFIEGDWNNFTILELSVYDFMDLLKTFKSNSVKVAGFPNKNFNSIVVEAEEILNHLIFELDQYN